MVPWDSEAQISVNWLQGWYEVIKWFRELTNSEDGPDTMAVVRKQEGAQEKEGEGVTPDSTNTDS